MNVNNVSTDKQDKMLVPSFYRVFRRKVINYINTCTLSSYTV